MESEQKQAILQRLSQALDDPCFTCSATGEVRFQIKNGSQNGAIVFEKSIYKSE